MKNNSHDGHDPHREFMEWIAAVEVTSPSPTDEKRSTTNREKQKITPAA